MKVMPLLSELDRDSKKLATELKLLALCDHPNIIKLYGRRAGVLYHCFVYSHRVLFVKGTGRHGDAYRVTAKDAFTTTTRCGYVPQVH